MGKKKQLYLVTYIGGDGYWDGGRWNDGETIEGTTRNPEQWIKQSNSDRGWIEMDKYTDKKLAEFLVSKHCYETIEEALQERRENLIEEANDNQDCMWEDMDQFRFESI